MLKRQLLNMDNVPARRKVLSSILQLGSSIPKEFIYKEIIPILNENVFYKNNAIYHIEDYASTFFCNFITNEINKKNWNVIVEYLTAIDEELFCRSKNSSSTSSSPRAIDLFLSVLIHDDNGTKLDNVKRSYIKIDKDSEGMIVFPSSLFQQWKQIIQVYVLR